MNMRGGNQRMEVIMAESKKVLVGWVAKGTEVETYNITSDIGRLSGPDIFISKFSEKKWAANNWPPQKVKVTIEIDKDKEVCEWEWDDSVEAWVTKCDNVYHPHFINDFKEFKGCPYCLKEIKEVK